MLPLLSPEQRLLSFNGWSLETLDPHFLAAVETSSSQTSGLSNQCYAQHKVLALLRQVHVARTAIRAIQAHVFQSIGKSFDLFHAVNYAAPATINKPILPVIYDLSHLRFPHTHPMERIHWLKKQLNSIGDLPVVQTISEFSKSEIVTLLGISRDRVYVTYPGTGALFRPERDADDIRLKKYKVDAFKYLLAVGTRQPRKNFAVAAEAYTALPNALKERFPFIWVGPSGWGDLSLSPPAERAKQMGLIRVVGYVPDRDLAALYRNTTLFVMPSLYEGFGMPVLEALACGAPVALSKIAAFQEIAGSCARYVDPVDVDGWRDAMTDAMTYKTPTASIPRGSPPDLARFSWQSSAAMTLSLYRRLAG